MQGFFLTLSPTPYTLLLQDVLLDRAEGAA